MDLRFELFLLVFFGAFLAAVFFFADLRLEAFLGAAAAIVAGAAAAFTRFLDAFFLLAFLAGLSTDLIALTVVPWALASRSSSLVSLDSLQILH